MVNGSGGCWVMYILENNLLHLHLGCHPNRDFCHHNRDSKIPTGVADFSNDLHQKLKQSQWKEEGVGGRRRARIPIEVAEFQIQSFLTSVMYI